MKNTSLQLKVLLPYRVFLEAENLQEIVAESSAGSFGLLPNRLDCVASLVPGILMYQTKDGKKNYLAIHEGVLVKTGSAVLVSVRNAVGGVDLGKLHETIEKEFKHLDEEEVNVRSVMAKLETGFIRNFEKFRHGN